MEFTKAFYSPHEVAEMASVHPSTILNYIASGRLYAIKLSARTFRIPVRSVIALLEPERLSPSTRVEEPDADLEDEFASLVEAADRSAPSTLSA
jgi:excisionase family DNA binding protein